MRRAVAVRLARLGSSVSRLTGFGDGTAIGGRLALRLLPNAITELTSGKQVVLVTGTNGKSTSATMLAAALGSTGDEAAFNSGGSNMLEGVAMALAQRPDAARVVAEVDEMVLGRMIEATDPAVVVLMNATREHTRGISLEETINHWEKALDAFPRTQIVANADDPIVVHVATRAAGDGEPIWVAGGLAWRRDATLCRRCGHLVRWPDESSPEWRCSGCSLARPAPAWLLHEGRLVGPGCSEPLVASMPGRWLASNAAFAVAAAASLGQPAADAIRAVGQVVDVDGRYRRVDVDGREVRLYLVKNPASWAEAITLASSPDAAIVFAMEPFGIRDLVPAWDVDASGVTAARIVATGQRRADVATWLETAGISAELEPDPVTAIRSLPPGPVYVIANYTAFRDLRQELS